MIQADQDTSGFPSIALLTVALVAGVGGYVLLSGPLLSERPKEIVSLSSLATMDETVDARLWQDPLQAIEGDWNNLVTYTIEQERLPPYMREPLTIARMAESISQNLNNPVGIQQNGAKLQTIAVLLNGGPYANDAENRRRSRYALISALTEARFVPVSPDRIGYFIAPQLPSSSNIHTSTAQTTDLCRATARSPTRCPLKDTIALVGFEWFTYAEEAANDTDEQSHPRVLILWLNNRDFFSDPIRHISSLLQAITTEVKTIENSVSVALIGPPDSGTLRQMVKRQVEKNSNAFAAEEIYSKHASSFCKDSHELLLELATPVADLSTVSCSARPTSVTQTDESQPETIHYIPGSSELLLLNAPDFVDAIIQGIDLYLDYGLPLQLENQLTQCLQQISPQVLRNCLQQPNISSIPDSDEDWQETVYQIIEPYTDNTYPQNAVDTIQMISGNEEWISSLLLAAHRYLDFGIPEPDSSPEFNACLRQSQAQYTSADPLQELQLQLSTCFRFHLTAFDSDPDWHDTIVEMWLADNPSFAALAPSNQLQIHIFSPQSTVPISALRPGYATLSSDSAEGDDRLRRDLQVYNFRSVLARDDLVLAAVLRELKSRGLKCDEDIAIVSELDSNYGRVMQQILRTQITNVLECSASDYPRVQFFGYLRGVDGESPRAAAVSITTGENSDSGSQASQRSFELFFPAFETAVGPHQLDYVRRIAENIGKMVENSENRPIQAIGVFGADFYDKQLIFQALRERVPNITLFTTDLDARLTDPEKFRWNRNLVVGSAHGLSWPAKTCANQSVTYCPSIPPFRDSYQTAFFGAVRMAIGTEFHESPYHPAQPRVFEIGRSGAIDITRCDSNSNMPCFDTISNLSGIGWLKHAGGSYERLLRVFVMIIPLLALTMFSYLISHRLPTQRETFIQEAHHKIWITALIGTLVITASLLVFAYKSSIEPFFLFEGVSAIPTLVLYFTAIVYSLSIGFVCNGRLAQGSKNVAMDFGFNLDSQWFRTSFTQLRKIVTQMFRNPTSIFLGSWSRRIVASIGKSKTRTIDDIWDRYHQLGNWNLRLTRAIWFAVIWTTIILIATSASPTTDPLLVRSMGYFVSPIRGMTLFFALIAVFLITDALRLVQCLIQALTSYDVRGWSRTQSPDKRVPSLEQTMQLILTLTKSVSSLILLPFLLMSILLLAHSTIFDHWAWTPTIVSVLVGFSLYLLVRAFQFRRRALSSRNDILLQLHKHQRNLKEGEEEWKETAGAIKRIKAIQGGAFVPWSRNPILQSLAFPSGGVGLLALLDAYFN